MDRRLFLKALATAPFAACALATAKPPIEPIDPNAAAEEIINRFYNGNVDYMIRAIGNDNIVTNIGSLSPASINAAFRMIERGREIPRVILTGPRQKRVIQSFGANFVQTENGKLTMWTAQVIEKNIPSLDKVIIILPNPGTTLSMIEIWEGRGPHDIISQRKTLGWQLRADKNCGGKE